MFSFGLFHVEHLAYLPKCMSRTDTSDGETPLILDAWPMVFGRIFDSFSRASAETDVSL